MTWLRHFRDHASDYVTVFFVALMVLVAGERLWFLMQREWYERQPVEEWVEYHSIEYVTVVPSARHGLGALRMVSDLTVHREVDLEFEDTLWCVNPETGESEIVSQNPATGSVATQPGPRRQTFWWFNADHPDGLVCEVESIISVDVGPAQKTIVVRSSPFTPT